MAETQLTTQPTELTSTSSSEVSASALIQQAITGDVGIEVIERLVALKEREDARKAESALIQALHDFQRDCPIIAKKRPVRGKSVDGVPGPIHYHFAPFEVISKIVRPVMEKHGLSFSHTVRDENSVCIISHRDGANRESVFPIRIDEKAPNMNNPQRTASGNSYAKRQSLVGGLGLTLGDDDDAQGVPDLVTIDDIKNLYNAWYKKHHPKKGAEADQFRSWCLSSIFKREMSVAELKDVNHWTMDDMKFANELLTRVTFGDYATDTVSQQAKPPEELPMPNDPDMSPGPSLRWSAFTEALPRANAEGLKSLGYTLEEIRGDITEDEYKELKNLLATARRDGEA